MADSVYQGIAKLNAPSLTPIKEYRSKPLTRGMKQFNRKLTTQSVSLKKLLTRGIPRQGIKEYSYSSQQDYRTYNKLFWKDVDL